ncbi:hypothetical protein E2C01_024962 [Portunus trituberculatus]|uniref:Uncharacterized protein n=1 Tax=Portunus trituberculatus TaxID=210409 RepID=A0A5B7EEQ3_PORTR|nr:hypothetical protein [Portunus trituberculatus]
MKPEADAAVQRASFTCTGPTPAVGKRVFCAVTTLTAFRRLQGEVGGASDVSNKTGKAEEEARQVVRRSDIRGFITRLKDSKSLSRPYPDNQPTRPSPPDLLPPC